MPHVPDSDELIRQNGKCTHFNGIKMEIIFSPIPNEWSSSALAKRTFVVVVAACHRRECTLRDGQIEFGVCAFFFYFLFLRKCVVGLELRFLLSRNFNKAPAISSQKRNKNGNRYAWSNRRLVMLAATHNRRRKLPYIRDFSVRTHIRTGNTCVKFENEIREMCICRLKKSVNRTFLCVFVVVAVVAIVDPLVIK